MSNKVLEGVLLLIIISIKDVIIALYNKTRRSFFISISVPVYQNYIKLSGIGFSMISKSSSLTCESVETTRFTLWIIRFIPQCWPLLQGSLSKFLFWFVWNSSNFTYYTNIMENISRAPCQIIVELIWLLRITLRRVRRSHALDSLLT